MIPQRPALQAAQPKKIYSAQYTYAKSGQLEIHQTNGNMSEFDEIGRMLDIPEVDLESVNSKTTLGS